MAVGNLVLQATNREPDVLVVVQHTVAAVVQVHVAIALRRTPEVRVVALAVETSVVPVASRQRRESKVIRAIATSFPAGRPAFRGL